MVVQGLGPGAVRLMCTCACRSDCWGRSLGTAPCALATVRSQKAKALPEALQSGAWYPTRTPSMAAAVATSELQPFGTRATMRSSKAEAKPNFIFFAQPATSDGPHKHVGGVPCRYRST